ncbi:MAG: hypothetical protein ACKOHI_04250, partial [Phycisphaerales bacterium]
AAGQGRRDLRGVRAGGRGADPASTPTQCLADFNVDGWVDGTDLGQLLGAWGPSPDMDLTGDGVVNGDDLGELLGAWGECP